MKRPFLGIFAMRLTIYEGLEARGSNRWPCLKVPAAQADKVAARHCPLVVGQSAGDGHLPETAESSMISNHFQSFPITFYKIMKRLFWDFRYAIDDLRGFGGAGVKPVAMPQSAGCAGGQLRSATLSISQVQSRLGRDGGTFKESRGQGKITKIRREAAEFDVCFT